jgi:hypothetical protein
LKYGNVFEALAVVMLGSILAMAVFSAIVDGRDERER